jgi:hypothetical protein
VAWVLAVAGLVVIDRTVTQTSLLWGPTAFENTRDAQQTVFAQTFLAARKLYAPPDAGAARVLLLGNSRILFGAWEGPTEAALQQLAPAQAVRVLNLGVFGAAIGDTEVLSRHVARLHPAVVVVGLNGADLLPTPLTKLANLPAQLLNVGCVDGPLPAAGAGEWADRCARSVWPFYRFREFERAALEDRVVSPPNPGPPPRSFGSRQAYFEYHHGMRAAAVAAAYRTWQENPTLAQFVRYLSVERSSYVAWVRQSALYQQHLAPDEQARRLLDALLARLARGPGRGVVLLMPENPLLADDAAGAYHAPLAEEKGVAQIYAAAARHQVPVIDARRWMPADAFFDFDHLFPDTGAFQQRLAEALLQRWRS